MKPAQFILNTNTLFLPIAGTKPAAISLIALLFFFLPLLGSAQSFDLTGYWQSDVGGCYQIRQHENEVFWAGGPSGSFIPHNVFHGAVAGNTLTGLWYDLPANPYTAFGESLSARIENNSKIVKVSESAPYRASTWTRVSGPCNNAGNQMPEQPQSGCKLEGSWTQNTPGVGTTTWITKGDGTANETGGGSAYGQANMKGNVLHIDWQTSTGYSGYYEWTLGQNCSSGNGVLAFKTGRTDTLGSTVKRN